MVASESSGGNASVNSVIDEHEESTPDNSSPPSEQLKKWKPVPKQRLQISVGARGRALRRRLTEEAERATEHLCEGSVALRTPVASNARRIPDRWPTNDGAESPATARMPGSARWVSSRRFRGHVVEHIVPMRTPESAGARRKAAYVFDDFDDVQRTPIRQNNRGAAGDRAEAFRTPRTPGALRVASARRLRSHAANVTPVDIVDTPSTVRRATQRRRRKSAEEHSEAGSTPGAGASRAPQTPQSRLSLTPGSRNSRRRAASAASCTSSVENSPKRTQLAPLPLQALLDTIGQKVDNGASEPTVWNFQPQGNEVALHNATVTPVSESSELNSPSEARTDECSDDLDRLVQCSPASSSSSVDSNPTVFSGKRTSPSDASSSSEKKRKLDLPVKRAFTTFTSAVAFTTMEPPDVGDEQPLLVMSDTFLKPSSQGGCLDTPKWLQSIYEHLLGGQDSGAKVPVAEVPVTLASEAKVLKSESVISEESTEDIVVDRCNVLKVSKFKVKDMRRYIELIVATKVHSRWYLDGLQKVHLSLKEGLYRHKLDDSGGVDLHSAVVEELCERKMSFAPRENIMNGWTLPCAFGRALAFDEVITMLLRRPHGSAAMFARPACHHVPTWRLRCALCLEADEMVDVQCGFAHCNLVFHRSCLGTWAGNAPKQAVRRKSRKLDWVCPYHGKNSPPVPELNYPRDEVSCGFSYINATAYALRRAQEKNPDHLLRMAIVDIDVHHGNGNQSVFYDDPGVLVISMHRGALVCERAGGAEFTGSCQGKGFNINLPLETGDGDPVALLFLHMIILPVLKLFAPDLVVVALGFDALDMGTESGCAPGMDCRFSREVYGDLVGNLKTATPRICLQSEGGYDPEQVGQAAVGCVKALLGEWPLSTEEQVLDSLEPKQVKNIRARVKKLKYRLSNLGWDI